jgi:hypothetical protein
MRSPYRANIREETTGAKRMQQQHKGLKPKSAATSRKQEGIQQDHQADFRAGVHEVYSKVFHRVTRSD